MPTPPAQNHFPSLPQGFAVRAAATDALQQVLYKMQPLDAILDNSTGLLATLDVRDRAFARAILGASLRRLGSLRAVLALFLREPVTEKAQGRLECILLTAAAQILCLEAPDHSAVQLAVEQINRSGKLKQLAALTNAVLRSLVRRKDEALGVLDNVERDVPVWLQERRIKAYGAERAVAIAVAERHESPLDLTVKTNPESWAEKLGGFVLPTGSVRLTQSGPVTLLDGFEQGEWWVQDAAASIPAQLLGNINGKRVADLCAAPGGKTAQLAAAGAFVTAVDRSAPRLRRLTANLVRLGMSAETVVADAVEWKAPPFDAVLLDAPCSATGTIRRHPDVAWLKSPHDITSLTQVQSRLLDAAVSMLAPGGTLVYSTCSLEPEEGENQITALLARNPHIRRIPVTVDEVGGQGEWITQDGDVRTLPCHLPHENRALAGLDGFFAARISYQKE
jgi:16S rRNA (cytosine967-C5)-methyltransferase